MTILKFQIIFLVFQLPRLFKLLHFLMDSLLKNDVFLSLDNAVKFIDKHSFDWILKITNNDSVGV